MQSSNRVSAYWWATVSEFVNSAPSSVLGQLASAHGHDLEITQRKAWEEEIGVLIDSLTGLDGTVYLEFDVPRLASRIDAVVVSKGCVFPVEFKCGAEEFRTSDYNQAWDYALDLKNFHAASHNAEIFPVLVATKATSSDGEWQQAAADGVHPPFRCNVQGLRTAIFSALNQATGSSIDAQAWGTSPYLPTPTIIEAARAMYSRHSVEAISRRDAGARNLHLTSVAIEEIIKRSHAQNEKAVIFVTGVPGAGKTLVGLNVATFRRESNEGRAVYLSGNHPLVAVLQEALTRDELKRKGNTDRKGVIFDRVESFIQNVLRYRDEFVRTTDAPADHIVIFDEAQRAWNQTKTSDFMRRRRNRETSFSEPEFLISYLDRHKTWGVVICLVGGGQEIHTGEVGIGEWLDTVRTKFPAWRIYHSPNLDDSEYSAIASLRALKATDRVTEDSRLHLSTSMRSFRSEKVSAFVKAVLDLDASTARKLLIQIADKYPIALTRDLKRAKDWVRTRARGSERFGLVASSQAYRLKPHAVDVRTEVDPVHWFLNERHDTRSSYYLEDAATEFQVQGLELDWVCITWDADLRRFGKSWGYHSFRGVSWSNIHKEDRKRYLLNAYRVLLTRARQGMVIFVPPGDASDPTRASAYYDETFDYLTSLGIQKV